jgi:hypothetical protein
MRFHAPPKNSAQSTTCRYGHPTTSIVTPSNKSAYDHPRSTQNIVVRAPTRCQAPSQDFSVYTWQSTRPCRPPHAVVVSSLRKKSSDSLLELADLPNHLHQAPRRGSKLPHATPTRRFQLSSPDPQLCIAHNPCSQLHLCEYNIIYLYFLV